ncbi:hypothetical protein Ocin01_10855 [Orchesella cincta]|uniref:Uncharacterized protein n=1 Tax=Orchesella cincta TaxID=48709 RepID=A0A1D2MS17_ORCCI|nr:hypothetical protein Ocin01_10855 [Orchesella cincta]
MEDAASRFAKASDMSSNLLNNNGRFSNRAARFYWADEEPSPQRAYSTQQLLISDSHFEESPYVIGAISAGAIGVAIIIIILVGFWIRSRLYPEGRNSEHPNNMSVRSSISTLDEDTYVVSMEMDGDVLGSMTNVQDHYPENATSAFEVEPSATSTVDEAGLVPEVILIPSSSDTIPPASDDSKRIEESNTDSSLV